MPVSSKLPIHVSAFSTQLEITLKTKEQFSKMPHRTPLSYILDTRSVGVTVGQTPNVHRNAFFLTTSPYIFWTAKFRKKLSENSSERPRFAQLAAFGVASYRRGVGRRPPLGH